MIITSEQVIAMKPCSEYTEEIIRANHGPGGITPREIAELDIPGRDRYWVLQNLVSFDVVKQICSSHDYYCDRITALVEYLEEKAK